MKKFEFIPWNIVGIVVAWKAALFFLVILASSLLPFNESNFFSNFTYPKDQKINSLTSFKTWDGQHYLYLAEEGYGPRQLSNAFQPLYPIVVRAGEFIFKDYLASALFISNVASFLGILLFYIFVKNLYGQNAAFSSTLLLISFPTAFFFSVAYTDGLSFFLLLCFFLGLYKNKLWVAAIFSFLSVLVRDVGVFTIVPLFLYIMTMKKSPKKIRIPTFNESIVFKLYKEYFFILAPVFGVLANFAFLHFSTGDMFSQFNAERYFIAGFSPWNVLNPLLLFTNLFDAGLALHGFTNSIIDRIFFVVYLIMLPFVYRKTDKVLFAMYLLFGITPLFGSFMAYTRYLLLAFPIFIASGRIFEKKLPLTIAIAFGFLLFQSFFAILHALSYWVA